MDKFEPEGGGEYSREEQLVRLYQLRDQVERVIANRGVTNPRSESERHLIETGHRLAYGCCR